VVEAAASAQTNPTTANKKKAPLPTTALPTSSNEKKARSAATNSAKGPTSPTNKATTIPPTPLSPSSSGETETYPAARDVHLRSLLERSGQQVLDVYGWLHIASAGLRLHTVSGANLRRW